MKLVTKLAAASIFALSAVAPAVAAEESLLLERDTYRATAYRTVAPQVQSNRLNVHRAVDALAFAPADATERGIDLGIGSQS